MRTLVGTKAPEFSANAVLNGGEIVENFSLEQFIGNKYVVLFFYPKDFTFVCPTELHAFQEKISEFESRNAQLVAVSTDQEFSHWAWLNTPKNKGGIQGVTYPLVADTNKTISREYGVLAGVDYDEEGYEIISGEQVAYRGLVLIDLNGNVRHYLVNDMPLGRNVDEAIRILDALQHFEEHGEVCPANWGKGKEAMHADAEGVAKYLSNH